jgi:hypothetical protein
VFDPGADAVMTTALGYGGDQLAELAWLQTGEWDDPLPTATR